MRDQQIGEGALSPYRVLDLTEGGCLICGLLLAQLGADVIKIEPPGGSPTRNLGPFYKDVPDPEKSLYWFAYNVNKRGITLDIETADGRQIFRKLVETSDFVIESFPPGYMERIGLSYTALSAINPRIVVTSITPFGQTGPYSNYKGPDIVTMAMGGRMYMDGSPDHPPTRISFPQGDFNAGLDAAVASLVAHYHRELTNEGQHVDVAAQPSVSYTVQEVRDFWTLNHIIRKRAGILWVVPKTGVSYTQHWQCKDGYVSYWIIGGRIGAETMRATTKWMDEEGMAPAGMKEMDWETLDYAAVTQEQIDFISRSISEFFMTHTKAELVEEAVKRRIRLLPVSTVNDFVKNRQLAARDWWHKLEHPELGETITYPGVPLKMTGTPLRMERRDPLIGEHNQDIYVRELGLSENELIILKQAKVI